MSSFVKHGNVSPFPHEPKKRQPPKDVEEFGLLLADALGATIDQLGCGDGLTLLEIMTSVPRSFRLRYIELRKAHASHKQAVKIVNAEHEASRR
jgi:hypothetical protein